MATKKELTKREAQQALKSLVKSLNKGGTHAGLLWSILSALRGPDSEDFQVKSLTTARIRGAIGLSEDTVGTFAIINSKKLSAEELKQMQQILWKDGCHFGNHYRDAVRAIIYFLGYNLTIEEKE